MPEAPEHARARGGGLLIDPDRAVEVCYGVLEHAPVMARSRSRFLQGFAPNVARLHAHLINDFFEAGHFAGRRVLDVGPGLYPFSILARELGAEVVAIEFDAALAELGERLGFEVHRDNLDMLPEGKFTGFDGVFLKGPFNACRQHETTVDTATARLTGALRPGGWGPGGWGPGGWGPGGWGWVANSIHPSVMFQRRQRIRFEGKPVGPLERIDRDDKTEDDVLRRFMCYGLGSQVRSIPHAYVPSYVLAERRRRMLTERQRRAFEAAGWRASRPSDEQIRRYALTYMNRPWLFTKGLGAGGE